MHKNRFSLLSLPNNAIITCFNQFVRDVEQTVDRPFSPSLSLLIFLTEKMNEKGYSSATDL